MITRFAEIDARFAKIDARFLQIFQKFAEILDVSKWISKCPLFPKCFLVSPSRRCCVVDWRCVVVALCSVVVSGCCGVWSPPVRALGLGQDSVTP